MPKKKIWQAASLAALMMFAASCAPVYKCGEPKPDKKLLAGKRLKTVVAERDELCTNLSNSNQENANLKRSLEDSSAENQRLRGDLRNTNLRLNDLQQNYDKLMSDNLSQASQFNQALKQKTEELENKERLLTERERALNDLKQRIARQDSITQRLNDIIRNALLGFNSDELSVEIKNGKVYVSMSDKLLFRSGSAAVETKGREAIKLLADVLNKNTDIDILIEGHTDNIPIRTNQFRDNWDLSVARATSIVRILTDEHRVNPVRVTASGKGEFQPRAGNDTAEGRALNRRTEIILSPKLEELMQLLGK
ncbi:MAG: OmpA family protein [Flavobacteriales bacterium]